MRRRMEVALYISLGLMLGLGIASYRTFMPDLFAFTSDTGEPKKKEEAKGIFSPPGTFEGGTVVPAAGKAHRVSRPRPG